MSLTWEAPLWLLLLPVWGGATLLALRVRLRLSYVGPSVRAGALWAYFPTWTLGIGLGLATLALSHPVVRIPASSPDLPSVWLLWDVSRSMKAQDRLPNRQAYALEQALEWLKAVEQKHLSGAIGMIVFARSAYPMLPLTTDREALRFALQQATRLDIGEGTDLSTALLTASALSEPGHVWIIVSDGAHNLPGTPSLEALARRAAAQGISIHTVLIGTEGPQLFPEALQRLSALTGGSFHQNQFPLQDLLRVEEDSERRYPLQMPLVFAAILTLLVGIAGMAILGWFSVLSA